MNKIFIRHAESERNKGISKSEDSPLTPWGQMQAHAAGQALLSYNLAGFSGIVSPSLRCRETASVITKVTGLNFVVVPHIRDWQSDVVMCGLSFPHESGEQAQKRIVTFWPSVADMKLVIISHQSPICVMYQLHKGRLPDIHADNSFIDNAKVII